ncbi:MAG: hypothetical protein JEZ09_16345 [Salinivirgaceae bacterium]|nr:hypothetical protein [Salinivirgaceae bacterium]
MFSRKKFSEDTPESKNKWLKRLQQESWELELLVSGFSILLLFKAGNYLTDVSQNINLFLNRSIASANAASIFIDILTLAVFALIINLTIHLLMRGFWVGIVGLGSVAPKTDIDKLNYSPFFTRKLKKKIGNLENLVVFLDNISSLIFAFAFLIVFLLLAIAMFFASALFIVGVFSYILDFLPEAILRFSENISMVVVILYLLAGVLYFIDFLSLGLIKKSKKLSKIYYPVYVFFGWITLAFMYRIIYYNLISRYSKKRVALVLGGYLVLMIFLPSMYMDHAIYFEESDSNYFLSSNYYANERNADDIIKYIDIPSKIISNSFVPLFIRYDVSDNGKLRKRFSDFKPIKEEELKSSFIFHIGSNSLHISYGDKMVEENSQQALACLSQFYKVYIDDVLMDSITYYFARHINKEEPGIQTMLDIYDLNRGEHLLEMKKEYLAKDSMLVEETYAKVPFWKE